MNAPHNYYLQAAGVSCLLAALLHLGCILFGGDWYRFLGAGEHMAQLAESGDPYPVIVTSIIAMILLGWSAYAFSGAGVILKLPFVRTILLLISIVLIARAVGFYFIMSNFPGNSLTFWFVSSSICLLLGLMFALGLKRQWRVLGN